MSAIPNGYTKDQVKSIQKALNEKTTSVRGSMELTVDGAFGPMSVTVLKLYQNMENLPVTGIYDGTTAASLDPFIAEKYLTENSFVQAANALNAEVAAVKAVTTVESKGSGFLADGRLVILFERHIFKRQLLLVMKPDDVVALEKSNADIINSSMGGYSGGAKEWDRLNRAIAINQDAALQSASFGLFQTMGFNHDACGYKTAQAMVNAYAGSETIQLMAFVNFNKANSRLLKALQVKDWPTYALNYNGSAYKTNAYDTKLAAAYKDSL